MANHEATSLPVLGTAGMLIFAAIAYPCCAQNTKKPAEESRLQTATFRAGLKKRGLTELLEQHLLDYPPASPTDASLMLREIKLAEFADPSRPPGERQAAVEAANNILEQLVEDKTNDPRRLEWMFSLAHSLLHRQAEAPLTALSYRGAGVRDREKLLAVTTKAVNVLTALSKDLRKEYDRIDSLSIRQFEKLEAEGYVEQLDALGPRAEYLTLWALLYDSLPRDDEDPVRTAQLRDLLARIEAHPVLIRTPHNSSRVQVQALLLTGMANRLLNRHLAARQHLERALAVAESMDDARERQRIDWAVLLTWLELIRNEVDDDAFDDALQALTKFHEHVEKTYDQPFPQKLMAALAERGLLKRRAELAARSGEIERAGRLNNQAWNVVARLADDDHGHRDAIYSTLYEMIDSKTPLPQLDPLELCALLAGLLSDAREHLSEAPALLDRALQVGEHFLITHANDAEALVPEVLHNLGVAEYRRGRPAAATPRFIEAARHHPDFKNALQSATFAVQLGAELYADPALAEHPDIQNLYRSALELLFENHADTDSAAYWRFYYAQLLDLAGDYEAAAEQYGRVDPTHEHFTVSLFHRARCLSRSFQQRTANEANRPVTPVDLRRFFESCDMFTQKAGATLRTEPDNSDAESLRSMLAEATLLAAEVHILTPANRPQKALDILTGFEKLHPGETGLEGRIWRVRVLAYQQMGRLEEAMSAIPQYIASAGPNAASTLQNLYLDLVADLDGLFEPLDSDSKRDRADAALAVATALADWGAQPSSELEPDDRRALTVQLAEATLRSNRLDRAAELFASLDSKPNARKAASSRDAPVMLGHAETLYRMGDFEGALPIFNSLATGMDPEDVQRWQALLRDLQCRDALSHPPGGIIRVIQQQKRLHPKLGGQHYAERFERLLRAGERRRDQNGNR